ncbi:isopeptide-forming domain-containing fimbrial protein [Streptococcus suis]|nr:isopeptide-forming domain-containing fimbrial protein [Streptococcus suis]NQO53849.1 isopeptide-forming domain-containing fimbrial protein [Streptococcus suis]
MKKITKLFSVFATLLTVFGTLVNLVPVAHAATQETTVIVHKVVMDETAFNDFEYQEDFDKYNGNQIDDLKEYFNTQSATEVKDVRFKVWKKVEAGTTATTETKTGANLGIADDNDNYQLDPTYPNGVLTTTNGAEFTLANGTYIFVEDKENSPYYNGQKELTGMKAVPFKLVLPQAKTDGTGYFDTNTPLHVYPKNTEDEPEITKEFTDKTTGVKDVNVGDTIGYTITTKVPKDAAYKTFAWEDTMVAGLDFNTTSLSITLNQVALDQADYTLTATKRGFTAKLTTTGLTKLENAAKAGEVTFTLTYNATLNDSAVVDTEIPNKVKLIYGNRPSEFTEPKSTNPSNGEIIVKKTWGEGTTSKDVVFNIYEEETGKFIKKVNLTAGTQSVTVDGLEDTKKYIVIEESVDGTLPTYGNDTPNTIDVTNKKNPNPNPLTPEDPKVITYGKRFVKTDDAAVKDDAKKLTGAGFVVTNVDGKFLALKDTTTQAEAITKYEDAEEAYVTAVKNNQTDNLDTLKADRDAAYEAMNMQWEWVDVQDKAFTFVSSADGKFEVKGLAAGTYNLVETKAPDGYALLTTPIEFVVGANSWTTATDTPIEGHQRVENKKVTIPQTGGIGTVVFTVVGLSAMVFAFIALKKRQSEEEA